MEARATSSLERFDSTERLLAMLESALGEPALSLLKDEAVSDLTLNPDGELWVDRLGVGREKTRTKISPRDAERIIFTVASGVDAVCSREAPILSAELPGSGYRFQAFLPPVVTSPVFAIRKKATAVFPLSRYVSEYIITPFQQRYLEDAVIARKNIFIVGGTGSGKTTLANALLREVARTGDRVVIIEDTAELQCPAPDCVTLRAIDRRVSMNDLLRGTMRLRPDRIVIGEVRGPEALTLLKAWNTGHPGGIATAHADSAEKGLSRIEQLVEEAGVRVTRRLIGDAIDVIVYIERTPHGRKVHELVEVGTRPNGEYLLSPVEG